MREQYENNWTTKGGQWEIVEDKRKNMGKHQEINRNVKQKMRKPYEANRKTIRNHRRTIGNHRKTI